jgi:hypothetical protein
VSVAVTYKIGVVQAGIKIMRTNDVTTMLVENARTMHR